MEGVDAGSSSPGDGRTAARADDVAGLQGMRRQQPVTRVRELRYRGATRGSNKSSGPRWPYVLEPVASFVCFRVLVRAEQVSAQTAESQSQADADNFNAVKQIHA
jgi:hypothetical protein